MEVVFEQEVGEAAGAVGELGVVPAEEGTIGGYVHDCFCVGLDFGGPR